MEDCEHKMAFILTVIFYMAPAVIAYIRGHKHKEAIGVLTLVFGWWNIIAWALCLVWSILK